MIDMEDLSETNLEKIKSVEFIVDYRDNKEFKVTLDLKRNNTLAEERQKLSESIQKNEKPFK